MARVELHTNCKIINVDKAKLVLVDSRGATIGPALDGNEGGFGQSSSRNEFIAPSSTPRRFGEGAMTPMHQGLSGSKTPAWNSSARTPNPYAMDGSKTPAWDVGSKTPNPHAFQDGSKTPAWDSGSKTPMWNNNSSSNARTPGFSDHGNKTPMWNSRYNDNELAPTPAAHTFSAQTPAVS
jgi:transcription elongation factor SPT5